MGSSLDSLAMAPMTDKARKRPREIIKMIRRRNVVGLPACAHTVHLVEGFQEGNTVDGLKTKRAQLLSRPSSELDRKKPHVEPSLGFPPLKRGSIGKG